MTSTMSRSEARYGDVQKSHEDEKPRTSRRQRRLRSIDQTASNQVAGEAISNGVKPESTNRNSVPDGATTSNGVKSETTNRNSVPDGGKEISSPESDETTPYRRKPSQAGRISARSRPSATEITSPGPTETGHENMNGDMTSEKRASFTKANTVATSGDTQNRREAYAKNRAGSSSTETTPRKLSQRSSSTAFAYPPSGSPRKYSSSQEEVYVQKSAAKLKSAWESRALSVSEESGKSPVRTIALGGTTGASSLKARFESPNPTYTRRLSKTRSMSRTDADKEAKHVSTSSLKSRFEEKNTGPDALPTGKRNFVINKGQAGEAAKKFNQAPSNSTTCLVCDKNVYPMEKLEVEGLLYHKLCFKCETCKRTVGLGNYAALEGKIYCKPHLKQLFALKGNYDEGFGREQRKADWSKKDGGNAPSLTKQSSKAAEKPKKEEPAEPVRTPSPEPEPEVNGNASEEETEAPVNDDDNANVSEPEAEPEPEPEADDRSEESD